MFNALMVSFGTVRRRDSLLRKAPATLSLFQMNNEILASRLNELKAERAAGEEQLRALDAHKAELQARLLRINGAIQVLEELVADQSSPEIK